MFEGLENHPAPGTPYLLQDPPRSEGRVLLSRALEEYVAIEWGIGPEEIAASFRGNLEADDAANVAVQLRIACGNLLDLLLVGRLRSFARPFGGGRPVPLQPHAWEVDDPLSRFATSATDPDRPFDGSAVPTHWIFVDVEDVAAIAARLCEGPSGRRHDAVAIQKPEAAESVDVQLLADASGAGLLRIAEVEGLTKMSRSTIYAKSARKEFPEPLRLGTRFSRWREAEVKEWLRAPR